MSDGIGPILLVDPNSATRGFHKALLQEAGYGVEEALNGVEGLERLRRHDCIMVVACVEMPKMDGLTLAERVRLHGEDAMLPMVLLGLKTDGETRRKALQAGANLFLGMAEGAGELVSMVDLLTGTARP